VGGAPAARAKRRAMAAESPAINVTANWTRHAEDGSLSAVVSFRLQSRDTSTSTQNQTITVILYWRTNTCNARPGFKYCDLPNSGNSRTYYAYYNQACKLSSLFYAPCLREKRRKNKKFELMLTRRAKAYSSSGLIV